MLPNRNKLIVLVGNHRVGKTTILNTFTKNKDHKIILDKIPEETNNNNKPNNKLIDKLDKLNKDKHDKYNSKHNPQSKKTNSNYPTPDTYKETYCCDFFFKEIKFIDEKIYLNIWDTNGSENLIKSLPSKIYEQSHGYFIFCSYDNLESLFSLKKWYAYLLQYIKEDYTIPVIVVANKSDIHIKTKAFTKEDLNKECIDLNIPYYETSTFEYEKCEYIFYKIAGFILGRSMTFRKNCGISENISLNMNKKNGGYGGSSKNGNKDSNGIVVKDYGAEIDYCSSNSYKDSVKKVKLLNSSLNENSSSSKCCS